MDQIPNAFELLTTKIEIPIPGSHTVPRERLAQKLQAGLDRRVTLLTAPAGYGKTTLLSEWISHLPAAKWRTAWVSLDDFDNTPLRLWSYIISALQKAYPELHFKPEYLVTQSYNQQDFTILHPLLNEITKIPYQIYLVLDDYHVVRDEQIHAGLAYLIEHQPSNLHLAFASRTSLPIPLARLRAHNQLLEISAGDLAFNLAEAQTFFSSSMDLDLPVSQIGSLLEATEGWIIGLQFAALSTQGQPSHLSLRMTPGAVGNRQILDFVAEEVLNRQPPAVQDFLLATSILTELSAPLCDALSGRTDSAAMLNQIEQANLFIVCLDDQGGWYRYHALFAETLQRRLQRSDPEKLRELHRRACAWLLDQGYPEQAVIHALGAGEFDQAAGILDSYAMQAIVKINHISTIQWISRFSDELIIRHPRLGIFCALMNYHFGQAEQMQAKIGVVEQTLKEAARNQRTIPDEPLLRWELRCMQAVMEFLFGHIDEGMHQALDAIRSVPAGGSFFYGFTCSTLAQAYEMTGQYDQAVEFYRKALQDSLDRGLPNSISLSSDCYIANVFKVQGRLNDAEREYERIFQNAVNIGENWVIPLTGLLEIALDRGQLERAAKWVPDIEDYLRRIENKPSQQENYLEIAIRLADYYVAQNDLTNAKAYWDRAMKRLGSHPFIFKHPLTDEISLQVRLWEQSGEMLNDRERLIHEIGLLKAHGLATEAEQIFLARTALAHQEPRLALEPLILLEKTSRITGANERLMECLILQALAHQMDGEIEPALRAISEALDIAAPEGYVRVFIDEGEPMKNLLGYALAGSIDRGVPCETSRSILYAARLMVFFEPGYQGGDPRNAAIPPEEVPTERNQEPLTDREKEVLALLIEGKSRQEIADTLVVSVNTLKCHLKKIYRKVGSHNRVILLQRAAEMGLRPGSADQVIET